MSRDVFDIAIIGGGINGAGIAADASGRGLSVLLAEMGDLAGATSSASSKLIHGGLRYLEHGEFRLVRESLEEREVLLAKAPHIIWPLRFVLPHVPGMRPRPLIRLGLALYDRLAERRVLPPSETIDLARDPSGRAIKRNLTSAFAYHDCWVDDARLVVLNACDAANRGATIKTRTRVLAALVEDGLWRVRLEDEAGEQEIRARALVNASGPWAAEVARLATDKPPSLRLVKGSHIVVPRIAGAEDAYLMQSPDGRVVFALPFEERFTLIGTTDVSFAGNPDAAHIGVEEETYLLDLANRFFNAPIYPHDIVWRLSGVRPLVEDGKASASAVSRDYRLELAAEPATPPLLTVVGGKLTTYRRLAEAALAKLAPYFPGLQKSWTATTPLPGGDMGEGGFAGYRLALARRYPELPKPAIARLARLYGSRAEHLLGDAKVIFDLGAELGGGLTEREAIFLRDHEWARAPDDILWRRTKAGLNMTEPERHSAQEHLARLL